MLASNHPLSKMMLQETVMMRKGVEVKERAKIVSSFQRTSIKMTNMTEMYQKIGIMIIKFLIRRIISLEFCL